MNEYKTAALQIIHEWESMDGKQQQDFCRNCVRRSIKRGRRLAHGDELADAVNDTFIIVLEQLADADKLAQSIERRANKGFGDSLAALISRAANAVLQREMNQDERDSVVISDTATNSSGETYSLFDTVAGTADTEKTATIKATLKAVYDKLDTVNQVIFRGMVEGKTEREMAPAVNLSNVAVHKRVSKIRATLAAALI